MVNEGGNSLNLHQRASLRSDGLPTVALPIRIGKLPTIVGATAGNLRGAKVGGAYQFKVEPHEDILTVLSGLTELTSKLELLNFDRSERRELSFVL